MRYILLVFLVYNSFQLFAQDSIREGSKDSGQKNWVLELIELSDTFLYDQPSKSLNYAKEALKISEVLDDKQLRAVCYNRIGMAHWSRGDLNESLKWLDKSLRVTLMIGDVQLAARNMGNIGNIYAAADMNTIAMSYYHQALDIFEEYGDTRQVFVYHNNIAKSFLDHDELDSAEMYLKLALEGMVEETERFRAILLIKFAELEFERMNTERSDSILNVCLDLGTEIDDKRATARANRLIAEIMMSKGETTGIVRYAENAHQIALKSESKELIRMTSETLSKVYASLEDFEKSYQLLQLSMAYNDSLQGAVVRRQLMILEQDLEQRRVDLSIARMGFLREQFHYQNVVIFGFLVLVVIIFVLTYLYLKNLRIAKRLTNDFEKCAEFRNLALEILKKDIGAHTSTLIQMITLVEENPQEADMLVPLLPAFKNNAKETMELLDSLAQLLRVKGYERKPHDNVDVGNVVNTVLSSYQDEADEKEVELDSEVDVGETVVSSQDSIKSILSNLVGNSIRFSDGGVISVYSLRIADRYKIIVRDEGVGMSEEQLSLLFSENQIVTKGTRGESGTGMGLRIVKSLADEIGAEIEVKSEESIGTAVSISLPI